MYMLIRNAYIMASHITSSLRNGAKIKKTAKAVFSLWCSD